MTMSRTFRGYFNRARMVDKGRRRILMIELPPEESAPLDEMLGRDAHRSRNIPISFVIGEPAETLAIIRDELEPRPSRADVVDDELALTSVQWAIREIVTLEVRRQSAPSVPRPDEAEFERSMGMALDALGLSLRELIDRRIAGRAPR